MCGNKYMIYRYNSFLKDDGTRSLIRVGNKEYQIPKDIFNYDELLNCIFYFSEPREVVSIKEYSLESQLIKFLVQIKVLNISEIDYPKSKILRYLIKKYKDFNNIEIKLAQSEFKISCFGDDCDRLRCIVEEKLDDCFFDLQDDKKKNRFHIIVVNQYLDYEKIKVALENEEAQYSVAITFNNNECRVFIDNDNNKIIKMLQHFMKSKKEKIIYSNNYYFVAINYAMLLIMDSQAETKCLYNTYSINSELKVENKRFYGLDFDYNSFIEIKSENLYVNEKISAADTVSKFIDISKEMLDIDFEYEFINTNDTNEVITKMRYIESIIESAEDNILLQAAKKSISKCLRSFFEKRGVKVQVAFGAEEINKIKSEKPDIAVFKDCDIFSEIGVVILRMDEDYER